MTRPRLSDARLGALMLLVAALVVGAVLSGVYRSVLPGHGGGTTVRAEFDDAQQVQAGDPVRVRGVEVGRVDSVARAPHGRARVVMKLNEDAPDVHADARAALRWRTALGGAFVVDLDPGTHDAPVLGGAPIPSNRTAGQIELDDLTDFDQAGARRGLQTLPREIARANRDPDVGRRALEAVNRIAPSLQSAADAIEGERDDELRRLLRASAATVRALDTSDRALGDVTADAATTLGVTAGRSAQLHTAVARLPRALRQTETTLTDLRRSLRILDPVVRDLSGPAPLVAPTVRGLIPLAIDADGLLDEARPALRGLRPAVRSLMLAAQQGVPLLRAVTPSLRRLDDTILPYLNEIDPQTEHTTAQMIGPAIAGLGSGSGGQEDRNGHYIRFPITSGSGGIYLPCQAFPNNPDVASLQCQALQRAFDKVLSSRPRGKAIR